MKKITFWIAMLITSFGFSQALPFDFDNTLHGFVGDGGTTVGNGTGSDVLEITGAVADWDNAQVTFASPIDLSDTANNTLRFTIQSTTAAPGEVHQHGVSFQGGGGAIEMNFQTTGTDPVNVELNFGDPGNGTPTREKMVIFTDVGNFGVQSGSGGQSGTPTPGLSGTYIIDNISLGADPAATCSDGVQNGDETGVDCGGSCPNTCAPTSPTVAAPTPPAIPAASVKSIFSDAFSPVTTFVYTDNGGSNMNTYNTNWCAANTSMVMVAGNATNFTEGLGCEGIDFQGGRIDATNLDTFHIDIWTQTDTMDKSFNILLSQWSGGAGQDYALEYSTTNASAPVSLPSPNPGTWISLDIPLNSFVNNVPPNSLVRDDIAQIVLVSNLVDVYYDNLYFYDSNALSVEEFSSSTFNAYPNPTQDTWTIKSKNTPIESISVYNVLGKEVLSLKSNKEQVDIDASGLKSGIYFAKINTLSGNGSVKLIKQ
ncbi:MAG: T9SS type A sorting domain-containing protein [Jejuia sp.]